jgi:hypothetical protein
MKNVEFRIMNFEGQILYFIQNDNGGQLIDSRRRDLRFAAIFGNGAEIASAFGLAMTCFDRSLRFGVVIYKS